MPDTYAHMCRDEHVQIGHNDSEHEHCPLCRALNVIEAVDALIWSDPFAKPHHTVRDYRRALIDAFDHYMADLAVGREAVAQEDE